MGAICQSAPILWCCIFYSFYLRDNGNEFGSSRAKKVLDWVKIWPLWFHCSRIWPSRLHSLPSLEWFLTFLNQLWLSFRLLRIESFLTCAFDNWANSPVCIGNTGNLSTGQSGEKLFSFNQNSKLKSEEVAKFGNMGNLSTGQSGGKIVFI